MSLPLPLPEPPADAVAQALDELRQARRELNDAQRMARMLTDYPLDDEPRATVERAVAGYRAALWREHYGRAVERARQLGLDVTPTS